MAGKTLHMHTARRTDTAQRESSATSNNTPWIRGWVKHAATAAGDADSQGGWFTREAGAAATSEDVGVGGSPWLCVALSLGLSKPSATNLLSRALGAQALPSFGYRRSLLAARGLYCTGCVHHKRGLFLMRLKKFPEPTFPDADLVTGPAV